MLQIDLEKLEFWQGDACNLKPHFKNYDLIIAINLLDRLYDAELFLRDMAKRLNKDGKKIYSQETINKILNDEFELVETPFEVEFVIQEHIRKYQHTFSQFSVWKKL
ncbi:MAG TPA: hypothetical protein EYG93_02635 [Sulfurospirillum arcachonense]|nr:hypothetical protein [Sulfurospirillum arcachonense]HIP44218.1 hypothetical protein [Sulfurospirillum arcachonense]